MDEFIFSDGLGDLDQKASLSSNLLAQQQHYYSQTPDVGHSLEQNVREPVIELTEGPATTLWNRTPQSSDQTLKKETETKVSVILACTSCNQRYQLVCHREQLAKTLAFQCTYCQRHNNNSPPNSGPRTYSQPNKKKQVEKNECEICGAMFVDIADLIKHLYVHCVQTPAAADSRNPPRARKQKEFSPPPVTTAPVAITSDTSKKCQYCGQKFNFLSALNYHEKGHLKYFRSKILEKSTNPEKAAEKPQPVKVRGKKGVLWCNQCYRPFKNAADCRKHMLATHAELMLSRCPICDKGFRSVGKLNEHVLTHSQPKETQPQCQVCGETFLYVSSLMRHQRIAHRSAVSPTHPEEPMAVVLPTAPALPDKTVEAVVNTILNCLESAESDAHGSVASPGRESALFLYPLYEALREPWPCQVCGKRYKHHMALSSHLKAHRKPNKGQLAFQCKDCDLCFTRSSALLKHCKIHVQGKSSSSQVALKRPKRRSDDPQNLSLSKFAGKRQKCEMCGLVFSPGPCFNKHKKNHKEESRDEPNDIPRPEGNGRLGRCLVCGQWYLSKSHVIQHFVAHADEKPYKCCICGQVFAYRKFFESHCKHISCED